MPKVQLAQANDNRAVPAEGKHATWEASGAVKSVQIILFLVPPETELAEFV